MKKLKIIFVSSAILLAAGSAWAGRCALCEYYTQYRDLNGYYVQAGTMGVNYICIDDANTCTYYRTFPTQPWQPCHEGTYYPLY
jgi:hypothetical protein